LKLNIKEFKNNRIDPKKLIINTNPHNLSIKLELTEIIIPKFMIVENTKNDLLAPSKKENAGKK
jgi:hypothetical protein